MGDEQKDTTSVEKPPSTVKNDLDDESADEHQLKIVEDEPIAGGSSQLQPTAIVQTDLDTSNEEDPNHLHAPNNNNELASPSTSSQKAGCSKGGVGKAVQPNFDFDYDGPPVVVSNGMALELVNRFGLNNAWGAFLKLKGYHTPYDKNAPQPPEHIQALKRFRRKIRTVREMFNALRDKNEDADPLMGKEFIILLKSTNENGGPEAGGEQPPPTSTTPDLPATKEKKSRARPKKGAVGVEEAPSTSVTQPISVQIDPQPSQDVHTSSNGAVPADPTQPKRQRKSTAKKDAKRETVISSISDHPKSSSSNAAAANQSKIDEIVTNVIDRVMASSTQASKMVPSASSVQSQAKGGDAPEPTHSMGQNVQMQPALLGLGSVEQLQELYRLNPALFNSFNPQASTASGIQSLLSTVKSSTSMNPSVTTPLTLNTGQNKLLFHQPGPNQQAPHAFLDSSTAQLFFPPPQTPQHAPGMGGFGIPYMSANPVAAIRAALQQQHHQMPPGMFSGIGMGPHGVGQALQVGAPHWPTLSAFDPTQLSMQQLHASTSQPQTSTSVQSSPDKPLTVDIQPDEDKKIDVTASPNVKPSKALKESKEPDTKKPSPADFKPRKQSKSSTLSASVPSSTKQPSPKSSTSTKKQTPSTNSVTPTSSSKTKKEQKPLMDEDVLVDLREQIEQLESQLNAERTKLTVQRRRMDSMRDKMKKKDDELQTARIDYACQKTDNASLKQQIETLRVENDEFRLRLKEPPSSLSTSTLPLPLDTPSSSRQSAPTTTTSSTKSSRTISTRRRQAAPDATANGNSTKLDVDETIQTPPPEKPVQRKRKAKATKDEVVVPETAVEKDKEEDDGGERRQSKRLRGARPKVQYSAYS